MMLFSQNQVFVTSGNRDKVKPEINKIVEEDNKEASKEGCSQTKAPSKIISIRPKKMGC